ncbi:hypothetical protein DXG01_005487 [Tephrocybe rancida]|nr:hypothetical protein DXG01_005487 [Tephrocybe rancida]
MVEYVDEVNASNMEHQQRITSAIGHLSGIVDALPIGAAAGDEVRALASRVSELEESTNIGFKHLKERILKHWERCDLTSARVTDLEKHIQKVEESQREQHQHAMRHQSLIAEPAHQGRMFVSPSPSTPSMESSEEDDEREGELSLEDEGAEHKSDKDIAMGEISEDPPSPTLGGLYPSAQQYLATGTSSLDQPGEAQGPEDAPVAVRMEGQGAAVDVAPQVAASVPAAEDNQAGAMSEFSATDEAPLPGPTPVAEAETTPLPAHAAAAEEGNTPSPAPATAAADSNAPSPAPGPAAEAANAPLPAPTRAAEEETTQSEVIPDGNPGGNHLSGEVQSLRHSSSWVLSVSATSRPTGFEISGGPIFPGISDVGPSNASESVIPDIVVINPMPESLQDQPLLPGPPTV